MKTVSDARNAPARSARVHSSLTRVSRSASAATMTSTPSSASNATEWVTLWNLLWDNYPASSHRRSQGVQWVHLHPQGSEKIFFQAWFTGKMCKCAPQDTKWTPPSQSKSQFFGQFLLGDLDLEVYLDGHLRATTKKKSTFLAKKSTPDKILATPARSYNATLGLLRD